MGTVLCHDYTCKAAAYAFELNVIIVVSPLLPQTLNPRLVDEFSPVRRRKHTVPPNPELTLPHVLVAQIVRDVP